MSVENDIAITQPPEDDGDESKRRRLWSYFRRSEPTPPSSALAAYSPDDHLPPTALRRWADRHTGHLAKPHPQKIKATASYWARTAPKLMVVAVPKAIKGLIAEVLPVMRGIGRVTEAYLQWMAVPSLIAAAAAAEAAGTKSKALLHHHSAKSRRATMSLIGAAALVGGGFYLYFVHPWWLIGIGVILLGALDAIGRRGQPTKDFVPVPRQPLSDGMPLRQLTESILAVFGELGLTVTAEGVVTWDIERKQYRLGLATFDYLTPEHMRGVERGIGAPDDSIRLLRVPETATSKLMVIQYGDPIPVLPSMPDRPTGSLTINDAYVLGESTGDYPFAMHFAGSHVIVVGTTGAAKALSLNTKVPTPTGWATMGELERGDWVYGSDGQPCRVVIAHPVHYGRPCYDVIFSDGSIITADAAHLWEVETAHGRANGLAPKVLGTSTMAASVRVWQNRANYSVRVATALNTAEASLPVDPYVLGVWLGDGNNEGGLICNPDLEITDSLRKAYPVTVTPSTAEHTAPAWRVEGLTARLRAIGLLHNKHIPAGYFRASEAQRRALLAGLLDSDGTCSRRSGGVAFSATNEQLARDLRSLVATLGYKSKIISKPATINGRDYGPVWIVSFTPAERVFRLSRKAANQVTAVRATSDRRYITEIRPVPSVPVRCITVDEINGMYLVGDQCIPTHNSSVHLNNIIDSISVSRDAVAWGIDLTRGPLFSMWRDVIQKKAYTPDEADALLDAAIAEIDRRAGILDDIANDDDPTNDTSEWNTSLGPALVIIVDEFPVLAKYNGIPKDTLNLLEKVERIHRTGRKFLVSLIIGVQKMGNADTGSSVVSSQSGQVIVGPCTMRDTVDVFGTDGRDFGYAPQNLKPGVSKTQINDAGKAFVKAPGFGPDVVRGYGAMAPGEIKRRAAKRVADGLPSLGAGCAEPDIDAVIVPPAIGALEAAFKTLGVRVPSALVVEHANNHGGGQYTPSGLAKALREECAVLGVDPPQPRAGRSELSGNANVQHYYIEDLRPALDCLG